MNPDFRLNVVINSTVYVWTWETSETVSGLGTHKHECLATGTPNRMKVEFRTPRNDVRLVEV